MKLKGVPVGCLPKMMARKMRRPAVEKAMADGMGGGFGMLGILKGRIAISKLL